VLLAEYEQRLEGIKRKETELDEREASLQTKISEVRASEESLKLREEGLHCVEQTVQLQAQQHKDATELLDRLSAIGKLLFKFDLARTHEHHVRYTV
jgi:hypothetical protein